MKFQISKQPIAVEELTAQLSDRRAGALASFAGLVRDHNQGKQVNALDYEVFEALALSEGEKILAEAQQKFGAIEACAVHREGALQIGDCAVWVGVLTAHRAEAFAACRYIIDEIKHRLPIWKKEHYAHGKAEWVNCQHQNHHHNSPLLRDDDYYARQIRLPEIGAAGQAKLKAARVLVVGSGGLGAAALPLLAGAGVGVIGIVDGDVLDVSNLHRQTIYKARQIGKLKAQLACEYLLALNPLIKATAYPFRLVAENCANLLADYDLVLDCTDNFAAKYLLSDAAILLGKTVIQASIHRFNGQLLTLDPAAPHGCLRCLWPTPPAQEMVGDCAETGVLGAVPALFGVLQAQEAIKHILGLSGLGENLLLIDLLSLEQQKIKRQSRADCIICGVQPTQKQLVDLPQQITEQGCGHCHLPSFAALQQVG